MHMSRYVCCTDQKAQMARDISLLPYSVALTRRLKPAPHHPRTSSVNFPMNTSHLHHGESTQLTMLLKFLSKSDSVGMYR